MVLISAGVFEMLRPLVSPSVFKSIVLMHDENTPQNDFPPEYDQLQATVRFALRSSPISVVLLIRLFALVSST